MTARHKIDALPFVTPARIERRAQACECSNLKLTIIL